MFGLKSITHGERWQEKKDRTFSNFGLDGDGRRENPLPSKLPKREKMRYYKLKLCAAFAYLGYSENTDEMFDSIEVYKIYRSQMDV